MKLIGHRGCADQHPENTVGALVRAAAVLDAVEVDVRRCGSGEPVVFHDETVDRVTDAAGPLSSFDHADLCDLEVLDSEESVPLLSTVLAAVPDDATVQVELKERGLAADVRDVVADHDVDVSVSSFDAAALAEVADLDWSVSTGFLFDSDPVVYLERALDLGCDAVHPHYDHCLETDVVDAAHAEGLDVVAWKAVETAEEVERLRRAGVDAVTADRWDVAEVVAEPAAVPAPPNVGPAP
jgi:glycerophosphoryl diester phosphodiesterase